ncbi:MAG TPA: hypothetical protein VFZ16_11450 [Hyphomicrobiaceae bacterium]|nr:hypothetical protein [Hyphomicrobiaceae bacterium]
MTGEHAITQIIDRARMGESFSSEEIAGLEPAYQLEIAERLGTIGLRLVSLAAQMHPEEPMLMESGRYEP